jgi:exodeoxyribonuclease-1
MKVIAENKQKLSQIKHWPMRILEALKVMDAEQNERYSKRSQNVDAQLYDGFFADADKQAIGAVRKASSKELSQLDVKFKDIRLNKLLPLYKARNFPETLTDAERADWRTYAAQKLLDGEEDSRLAQFEAQIQDIMAAGNLTVAQEKIIGQLQAYAEEVTTAVDGE